MTNMRHVVVVCLLLALLVTLCTGWAHAQKAAQARRGGDAVAQALSVVLGNAARLEPMLPAVFELTDEQRTQIAAAAKDLLESPALKELRQNTRDKDLPDDQRKQARQQLRAEMAKIAPALRTRLEEILTAEQNALCQQLVTAADEVQREARKARAGQIKGKDLPAEERRKLMAEARQAAQEEFGKKLDAILTDEQKQKLAEAKENAKRAGGRRRRANP